MFCANIYGPLDGGMVILVLQLCCWKLQIFYIHIIFKIPIWQLY